MVDVTRALFTLAGATAAGVLIWTATRVDIDGNGDYWGAVGLLAGGGLVLALSQLLGGWTKWGWPRISAPVFVLAFVPALIAAGWVLAFNQPASNWLADHIQEWSSDLGIDGLVDDLDAAWPVLAFGLGLLLGFTLDTRGPETGVVAARGASSRREHEAALDREHVETGESAPTQPLASERAGAPGAAERRRE
jgi:hypothetical protein